MYTFDKKVYSNNLFLDRWTSCCKLLYIGICRHHASKLINYFFVKLIILYNAQQNVSHIQKLDQDDILWYPKWSCLKIFVVQTFLIGDYLSKLSVNRTWLIVQIWNHVIKRVRKTNSLKSNLRYEGSWLGC
jgi:hypothetical protein